MLFTLFIFTRVIAPNALKAGWILIGCHY